MSVGDRKKQSRLVNLQHSEVVNEKGLRNFARKAHKATMAYAYQVGIHTQHLWNSHHR